MEIFFSSNPSLVYSIDPTVPHFAHPDAGRETTPILISFDQGYIFVRNASIKTSFEKQKAAIKMKKRDGQRTLSTNQAKRVD